MGRTYDLDLREYLVKMVVEEGKKRTEVYTRHTIINASRPVIYTTQTWNIIFRRFIHWPST